MNYLYLSHLSCGLAVPAWCEQLFLEQMLGAQFVVPNLAFRPCPSFIEAVVARVNKATIVTFATIETRAIPRRNVLYRLSLWLLGG